MRTHLDDGGLPERHALHGQLGAEVTPGHHCAIHRVKDGVEHLHRIGALDLCEHLRRPSARGLVYLGLRRRVVQQGWRMTIVQSSAQAL